MSRYLQASGSLPTILPPQHAESKRDRKRRETVNKIEILHDESWRNRDEKFSTMYKEYHLENKSVNTQPPTSAKYLLRLYPKTIERDALLEAAEVEYQYKASQAKKMYESERELIEAQYWDARDQVRQRLLAAVEDRRRRLREEKEGGDVVTETLLDAQTRPRPTRRLPFRNRSSSLNPSRGETPNTHVNSATAQNPPQGVRSASPANGTKSSDLLLHSMIAPALAIISADDIISSQSSSLAVIPPPTGTITYAPPQPGKRGPRGKGNAEPTNGDGKDGAIAAPGTATALGIASGQLPGPGNNRSRGAGGNQNAALTLGRSLADLAKMTQATQLEIDADWARMQGTQGRGRRTRGD